MNCKYCRANCSGAKQDREITFCLGYDPPKTNVDRIRSMTDEELAELLCGYQCNTCDFNGFCDETDKCKEEIFEWLQSESGEA